MAVLSNTSWTVTIRDRKVVPAMKRKRHAVTLQVGNGVDTYPAGGIPMPTFTQMGFSRFLDTVDLTDMGSADGFIYKYDEANNKMRIWQGDNTNAAAAPAVELGAVAVAAKTLRAVAWGW